MAPSIPPAIRSSIVTEPRQADDPGGTMGYDSLGLTTAVVERLRTNPLCSLQECATALGVDRHTITRALKKHLAVTFRELQEQQLRHRVNESFEHHANSSIKEIAVRIGYSCGGSLARRLKQSGWSSSSPRIVD